MAIGNNTTDKKKIHNVAMNQKTAEELSNLAAMLDKSKAEVVRLALQMFGQSMKSSGKTGE
jgi:hypothetical protein